MHLVNRAHLDEFFLLRYTVGELDEAGRRSAEEHLRICPSCAGVQQEIQRLDRALSDVASEAALFPPDDPFGSRPEIPAVRPSRRKAMETERLLGIALDASRDGGVQAERLLEVWREEGDSGESVLSSLRLDSTSDRFALLYLLQEARVRVAEGPGRALSLAESALARLSEATPGASTSESESLLAASILRAHAHALAGQACSWTGELERGRAHLEAAYRDFAAPPGDEIGLALTEWLESQRRSFAGKPEQGLVLARRAAQAFDAFELYDALARARVAEGLALSELGRDEEALACYREALPVFEERGLWSNYLGCLNNVGTSLRKLRRLDEARREYARALRRLSREEHRSLAAFIRNSFGLLLHAAGRYREAARSFARAADAFKGVGHLGDSLTAALWELECWALAGDSVRAAHRLDLFRAEVLRRGALDAAILQPLEAALSGRDPDLPALARLRRSAEEVLRTRLRSA